MIITCSPNKILYDGSIYWNPRGRDKKISLSGFICNICSEQTLQCYEIKNYKNEFIYLNYKYFWSSRQILVFVRCKGQPQRTGVVRLFIWCKITILCPMCQYCHQQTVCIIVVLFSYWKYDIWVLLWKLHFKHLYHFMGVTHGPSLWNKLKLFQDKVLKKAVNPKRQGWTKIISTVHVIVLSIQFWQC